MEGVFRLPHAKSSLVILTTALVLSYISQLKFNATGLLLSFISYILYAFTFEYLFAGASDPFRPQYLIVVLIDVLPALVTILFRGYMVALFLAPSAIFIAIYIVYAINKRGRDVAAMVAGSTALAALYFYFCISMGPVDALDLLVGALFLLYNASQVLYVESRLGFKRVNPGLPVIFILAMLATLFFLPLYFAIPIIEPAIKVTYGMRRNKKVSKYPDISKLGIKEAMRYSLFFVLLAISIVVYRVF